MKIEAYVRKRDQARKLASSHKDRLSFARQFLAGVIRNYFPEASPSPIEPLDDPLARELAVIAAGLDPEMAAYLIGTTYTVMLPEDYRGKFGVFYTPPSLTKRLLDLAVDAGVDWSKDRILDPACGGGAFLAPVAKRIVSSLPEFTAEQRLSHVEEHLSGFEIDAFGAWVSQVFLEAELRAEVSAAQRPLKNLVQVRDSLHTPESEFGKYDLVIGNPPYGKVKLSELERDFWKRSLYGHANLYGVFTDLAVRLASNGGVIAYVTPTSFLGGQYFQALRTVLGNQAPPFALDFIAEREGVFAGALQEACLSVYRKCAELSPVRVSYLTVKETGSPKVTENGLYPLPENYEKPWLLPRISAQSKLIESCANMTNRLADLGYTVSTGPLVWNRHKTKLFERKSKGRIPVIWAECVDPSGSGRFTFKATRNHLPWYQPSSVEDPNLVKTSCVLIQRTTSLEQSRRLIAAELSQSFIDSHGGCVAIENHLNMVRPTRGKCQLVGLAVLTALLNSPVADQIFRCISGSTAVSAFELESMPVPSAVALNRLQHLVDSNESKEVIDQTIWEMYADVCSSAAA